MKAKPFHCQACASELAKGEARFVDEDAFSFMNRLPEGLSTGAYCQPCWDRLVQPELDVYLSKMERARDVNVFYLSQSKESRFVRRTERPVSVSGCPDREEALLRLAFMAVEAGKNSLVDVELKSEKVREHSRQSALWSGRGIPAFIDEANLKRRFAGTPN